MKIHLQDTDGTLHEYAVPTIDEVSVGQWMAAEALPKMEGTIAEQYRYLYDLVEIFMGVPHERCRQIAWQDITTITNAIEQVTKQAKLEREEGAFIPDSVEFQGVTYTVPKDFGQGLTVGQIVDILSRLETLETADAGIAVILAVMLTEQGKGYTSGNLEQRIEAFKAFPCRMGIRLAAFFFVGSEPLSQGWDQFMQRILRSKLRLTEGAIDSLRSVGAGT
jgi:hypothetical protein